MLFAKTTEEKEQEKLLRQFESSGKLKT